MRMAVGSWKGLGKEVFHCERQSISLSKVTKEPPPHSYSRSAVFSLISLGVSGQSFAARAGIPLYSLCLSKARPEPGVEGAGLLASSFTAKIEGGNSWKVMKAGIYNTRKCIEAISKHLHRLLSCNCSSTYLPGICMH